MVHPLLSAEVTAVLAAAFGTPPDASPAIMMVFATVVTTFKDTRILLTTIFQAFVDAGSEKMLFDLH